MHRFILSLSLSLAAPLLCAAVSQYSSIDQAIARGDLAEVQLQLAAHPERAMKGEHPKLSPLNQSILRKKVEIALVLVKSGADVNQPDSSKRTPLHLCVERDLPKVAIALLNANAMPDEWDKAGWTPLHNAAAKDRLAIAKVLIDGGANPKRSKRPTGDRQSPNRRRRQS